MSNLGFEKALERDGIALIRTSVGDKYVLEEMIRQDLPLGGEQSGHVIFRDYATTGDGMLTALRVLEASIATRKTLDELIADLVAYPQKLENLEVKERRALADLAAVQREIRAAESAFNGAGRVLVRYSGTELKLRVMVEGADADMVNHWTARISDSVRAELT
jgi:phosphoglucosamine mutase